MSKEPNLSIKVEFGHFYIKILSISVKVFLLSQLENIRNSIKGSSDSLKDFYRPS